MSELIQVVPSGSVGKQVYASTVPVVVDAVILDAPTSAAAITIRDGNASGDVRLTMTVPLAVGTRQVKTHCKRFDRGMHVKVTGVNAKAYLVIK